MTKGLTTLIHEVVWAMDRKADEILKRDYGISVSWFRVLVVLKDTAPITQHSLAQRLRHSDPAVSRLLERMTKSGLLSVAIDPDHGRKRLVSLTPAGRSVVVSADSALEDLFVSDLTQAQIDISEFSSSMSALSLHLIRPPITEGTTGNVDS
ncbi:MarR family transcriptional regulator [Glaciihabitans sp. UYNi722]|uniref:MarR family winged helix-turn-helix transcriptional regulator n=1 Tax=Glaciihabitans sp. UYNi722 TaxID=3156344 RepID=UPI0033930D55